jgi:hypothetical protein
MYRCVYQCDLFAWPHSKCKERDFLQPQETERLAANKRQIKQTAIYSSRYQISRGPFAFPIAMAVYLMCIVAGSGGGGIHIICSAIIFTQSRAPSKRPTNTGKND